MIDLKPLSKKALPRALEKAERYRLLNEPYEAESICQDVLRADPENQQAVATLLLALTDQFHEKGAGHLHDSKALLLRLKGEYEQSYYEGVIAERWAKAGLNKGTSADAIYRQLREAMRFYESAAALGASGNEDAILRWNACARLLNEHPELKAEVEDQDEAGFGDEPPPR